MSLELVHESVSINNIINKFLAQTEIESGIIVPDSKTDVSKILFVDGEVIVNHIEVLNEKVHLKGCILYNTIYSSNIDEGDNIRSISTRHEFSYMTDQIKDINTGMQCNVNCDIDQINFELINERKYIVKIIVNFQGTISDTIEKEILKDIRGIDNLQILTNSVDMVCYLGKNNSSFKINELLEIPQDKPSIGEILRTDLKTSVNEYMIEKNEVTVKGSININLLYIGDNQEKSIESVNFNIPFNEVVDFNNIEEDIEFNIECKIMDKSINEAEDSDGEYRNINMEAEINLNIEGLSNKKIDYIEDAYSLNSNLIIEDESIRFPNSIDEVKSKSLIRNTIPLTLNNNVKDVLKVFARPTVYDVRAWENSISVEGIINYTVLLNTNEHMQMIEVIKDEIPFKHQIDNYHSNKDEEYEASVIVDNTEFKLDLANELELRTELTISLRMNRNSLGNFVVKAYENALGDLDKRRYLPSIAIYFPNSDDNLWSIAKKYNTTIEEICKINDMENDFSQQLRGAIKHPVLIPKLNIDNIEYSN